MYCITLSAYVTQRVKSRRERFLKRSSNIHLGIWQRFDDAVGAVGCWSVVDLLICLRRQRDTVSRCHFDTNGCTGNPMGRGRPDGTRDHDKTTRDRRELQALFLLAICRQSADIPNLWNPNSFWLSLVSIIFCQTLTQWHLLLEELPKAIRIANKMSSRVSIDVWTVWTPNFISNPIFRVFKDKVVKQRMQLGRYKHVGAACQSPTRGSSIQIFADWWLVLFLLFWLTIEVPIDHSADFVRSVLWFFQILWKPVMVYS